MTDHPITPPPELIQQWMGEFFGCTINGELSDSERYLATQAARWGAGQELEACISAVLSYPGFEQPELFVELLRAARRPKPPSLKEQVQRSAMTEYHPAPFGDFSAELREPWAVVERLRMALCEAQRYCLGAENVTGHCIESLLDRLPNDDD